MKRGTAVVMERNALPMAEERQRALEADWKRIDAARARREKLAAVSADALGRDRVGSIVKDLPRPFPPPAKGSIFTDVRKAIETQGALQYYFAEMRGHNLSIIHRHRSMRCRRSRRTAATTRTSSTPWPIRAASL